MADGTHIEWTDATWNPITGCFMISPACKNCYAMKLAGTRLKHHPSRMGLTKETKAGPVWTGEARMNWAWLEQPLNWRRRRMIFVAAHSDLFQIALSTEDIAAIWGVMVAAHYLHGHVFQVLTKRPDRMNIILRDQDFWDLVNSTASAHVMERVDSHARRSNDARARYHDHGPADPPPGVWLGVSVEDQKRANERRDPMASLAAAGWTTWVSYEPALGPVDWRGWEFLKWLVSGGESGADARPSHPDWHRTARDYCAANDIAFLFKQWGEWAPQVGAVDGWKIDDNPEISRFDHRDWEGGQWGETYRPMWCDDIEDDTVSRIGKKRAGRLLDGVEHNGYPEAAS